MVVPGIQVITNGKPAWKNVRATLLLQADLGDRLMVGLRTLTPPIKVRILVPQPNILPK